MTSTTLILSTKLQTVTRLDSNVVVALQQCCALEVNLIFSFVFVCCTSLKVLFDDRLDSMPSMALVKTLIMRPINCVALMIISLLIASLLPKLCLLFFR